MMAAATATILPSAPELASMDHRLPPPTSFADANAVAGRPLRSQRSAPSPSTPSSPFRHRATPDSPSIPHRRIYNIDDDPTSSMSRSSAASLTPSQSASNASPTKSPTRLGAPSLHSSPESPTRPLAHKKSAERRSKATRNQHLTNLEAASLSTPEVHLASDPMLDTAEPSFLRKLVRGTRTQSNDVVSGSGSGGQTATQPRANGASPRAGPLAGPAYCSFGAAMSVVDSHGEQLHQRAALEEQRSRKHSAATLRSADSETGSPSWAQKNLSTDTLAPPRGNSTPPSPTKADLRSSEDAWPRRSRKDTERSHAPKHHTSMSSNHPPTEVPMQRSRASAQTDGSETTLVSETNFTMLSDASFGMSDLASPHAALESIRKARSFMIRELSRLAEAEQGLDKQRVSALISQERIQAQDPSVEVSRFWSAIADGVLLCLLANRLRPGSVDRIDRRDLEWVKADNISRFLRAARDHLGLRSKDLFQSFDLTDGTVEGLLRVVHTLSATEKKIKRNSKVSAARANAIKIEPRTTSMTPPSTPRAKDRNMLSVGNGDLDRINNSSELSLNEDTPRRTMLTIQENRREAERKLMGKADPIRPTSSSSEYKRRSVELGYPKVKGASITFANSVKQNSYNGDEDGRMPYRDRKLSESAISLTGVAEEPEDGSVANGDSVSTAGSFSSTQSGSMERAPGRRGSSESDKSSRGFATKPPPLLRSTSQKRISQELALGQLPRAVIGSAENLDDYISASGSPTRHAPARRHSARLYAGPSLLNPSRESLLNLAPASGGELDTSPRVPFPKGANDSPGARRMARHLSMNGASTDSFSPASGPAADSNGGGSSSPKVAARPQFRHMRYSSDLHLPLGKRPTSMGGRSPDPSVDERSHISASRSRFDSEYGSIYTNTLGSLATDDSGGSAAIRGGRGARGEKQTLVVVEEGKPDKVLSVGTCIGKGQFGLVYKAIDLNSGQTLAVKKIKLDGRTDVELNTLMGEVDLMRRLKHPSIVRYEGFMREDDCANIILEFVENGSLLNTIKSFGNLPEKLVASYVARILESLYYLHEQNVVHCDLKAANILTTKNGNVKLSDFGVSLNLKAVTQMTKKNDAVGTPNWMAPEVIELKGVTTAADIWSLGCVIIELLTGKPPYWDMLAMSAMFRIVEDDCPPIPDTFSEPLQDMLKQCFNKDPKKRPSAEELFEHEWMQQSWLGSKELRPQDSVPFLRRISVGARRLDPHLFEEENKAVQPPMERSTSSPPPTLQRPELEGLRANTSPAKTVTASVTEAADDVDVSPTASTPVDLSSSPGLDAGSTSTSLAPLSVPMPISPTMLTPTGDTSILDLGLTGLTVEEEAKPHAFVKSSFSKAVVCKICREQVKKHAVICEECGLLCHARCAVRAPSPCDLRAQLLLLQQRASMDHTSPMSSAANLAHMSPVLSSSAGTAASPVNFRFPFGMKRQPRSPTVESQPQPGLGTSPSPEHEAPPSPPSRQGPLGSKPPRDQSAVRKRRISLIPGRQRSPSPPPPAPESTEALRSPYGNAAMHGMRRHSSMSYGSISGNSSISSTGGGILLGHSSSRGSSAQQHLSQAQAATSVSVLPGEVTPSLDRTRRRVSSGVVYGTPEKTPTAKKTGKLGIATGQVTPTPQQSALERKKSRRVSAKADCIIM